MKAFAAVDLGATSGRVVLGMPTADALETLEVHRFANKPIQLNSITHWDVESLFAETLQGLRNAVLQAQARGYTLSGIGVDTWGVDYGVIHPETGFTFAAKHHRAADMNEPERARVEVPDEVAWAISGVQSHPINTAMQLRTDRRNGTLAPGSTVLLTPDLWVYLLTNALSSEASIVSTTQLLDHRARTWSQDLLQTWGLADLHFPEVTQGPGMIALTQPSVNEALGTEPIPVFRVAGHDTASALAFATPSQPGHSTTGLISSGSWSLVGLSLNEPVLTEAARIAGYTNELGATGGSLFLRNLPGLWLLQDCMNEWSQQDGTKADVVSLLKEASEVPSESVATFEISDERFLAPGAMTVRIQSACEEAGSPIPSSRGEFVAAIVESLAQTYASTLITAAQLSGVTLSDIRIVGGGSRNALLCQRTADLTRLNVIAGPQEASALGNLALQLIASGEFPDLAAVYAASEVSGEPFITYMPR